MSTPEMKKAKEMQLTAEQQLFDEIDRAIHRAHKEADLTYNQIIGVLEVQKLLWFQRANDD